VSTLYENALAREQQVNLLEVKLRDERNKFLE